MAGVTPVAVGGGGLGAGQGAVAPVAVLVSPALAIKGALSHPRVGKFELQYGQVGLDGQQVLDGALELYAWNARVAAAMLGPMHICEVVLRNAVSDALEAVSGAGWPWDRAFEQSLPNPHGTFSLRRELWRAREGAGTTGHVIADAKMMFWQMLFTGRFDHRVWNKQLKRVLPNLDVDGSKSVQELRKGLHDDLEVLRCLRNRMAHHEPIFGRNLAEDYDRMRALVGYRCLHTQEWMDRTQSPLEVIRSRPVVPAQVAAPAAGGAGGAAAVAAVVQGSSAP